MKEVLNNVKCNLAKAQGQMKRRVDRAKHTKEWVVGDRVLLSTRNLWDVCTAFTVKIGERLGEPIHHRQGRQSSCLLVEFASRVLDSSNISC